MTNTKMIICKGCGRKIKCYYSSLKQTCPCGYVIWLNPKAKRYGIFSRTADRQVEVII